ncbi:MAG: cytochrome c biogenesis protein ResB [Chloroflexota bacterium]
MKNQPTESGQLWGGLQVAYNWLLRLLCSMRLALALILILTGLSLIGALLIQVPREVVSDPQAYATWIDTVARSRSGALTPFFRFLQLFDVFHSIWFLGAGSLLMLNILVCTLNRWKSITSRINGRTVVQEPAFYRAESQAFPSSLPPSQTAGVLRKMLGRNGYRVRSQEEPGRVFLSADKNRLSLAGTYLNHMSIILFVLGYLIGSYYGFRDTSFVVAEGSRREVGHGTRLSLELTSFEDAYYPDGQPKDYRSDVVLFKNGTEVKRSTIRVNYPLRYEGTRFYQSSFGPAVELRIRDIGNGDVLYEGNIALAYLAESAMFRRLTAIVNIESSGLTVNLLSSATNVDDPMIKTGEIGIDIRTEGNQRRIALDKVEPGVPRVVAGLEFTLLRMGQYSGFQVSRDPGNALIWIASTLFILGTVLVLYLPHRQLSVLLEERGEGGSQLFIRLSLPRLADASTERSRLTRELEGELRANRPK